MSTEVDNPLLLKCPFRATLITRSFSCAHACEITRRDGPDIGCDSSLINNQCVLCFAELKNRALPELGFTDDLTMMPASAVQKIQYGGLLALKWQIESDKSSDTVSDIGSLIEASVTKYGSIEKFPFEQCVDSIKRYKIKRRRGR